MSDLSKLVPVPDDGAMNGGLNSPHNNVVLRLLGNPTGEKTENLIVTMDVGPFNATGLKPFLLLLKNVFDKVAKEKPELLVGLKTAGCRAVRAMRGTKTTYSNHSWGIAIDLYYGKDVAPRGSGKAHQGILELYPYLHNAGLYWGAEFPTDDAMHFEASVQKLLNWDAQGTI